MNLLSRTGRFIYKFSKEVFFLFWHRLILVHKSICKMKDFEFNRPASTWLSGRCWPLIGQYRSRDQNTGLWLVITHDWPRKFSLVRFPTSGKIHKMWKIHLIFKTGSAVFAHKHNNKQCLTSAHIFPESLPKLKFYASLSFLILFQIWPHYQTLMAG